MASAMLAPLSCLLRTYPEIVLAAACPLLAFLYRQSSRNPANPTNWPLLGMLPGLLSNLGRFHDWATVSLRDSGGTIEFHGPWLLGMDFLVTCDPANVNHVFNANFANYPKGEEFSEMFDLLGDGIFNADNEQWRSQRRMAHAVMSSPKFLAFVARCSHEKVENALVPLLSNLARKGDVVDLQDVFLRLTFDMTCDLVFGVDPGSLSEGFPAIPFARAMDDAMEALFLRDLTPSSCWKLMRRLNIGNERKLAAARREIDLFVAENIARKRHAKGGGSDLLACYLEESSPVDDKFLRDTAVSLMVAGRDTTGVALAWFFWLLAKNPRVRSKILDEMRQNPNEEAAKLVYLHAALCESLRLYPPIPGEHKAPVSADVLPSGARARPNQKIFFNIYAMGRMEGVWGEDCLEFRPERWVSERGTVRHVPSYKFMSFNCGPRTCLGKEIAFTQMKTAAAAVICKFDFELLEGHVVEPRPSILLHMRDGLKVRVQGRQQ